MRTLALTTLAWLLAGCTVLPSAPEPTTRAPDPDDGWVEAFPYVRINTAQRAVEIRGIVPIDCHDPETPEVYLEVIVCTPDTREHETLAVTPALPSHVHAALLLVGLEPGVPGRWRDEDDRVVRVPPRGDAVRVLLLPEGATTPVRADTWVVNAQTGRTLAEVDGGGWVFAGSQLIERAGREWYDADGQGVLVGLHTFGAEVVAWRTVMSPESVIDEPVWIANAALVPEFGTPVRVLIEAVR